MGDLEAPFLSIASPTNQSIALLQVYGSSADFQSWSSPSLLFASFGVLHPSSYTQLDLLSSDIS